MNRFLSWFVLLQCRHMVSIPSLGVLVHFFRIYSVPPHACVRVCVLVFDLLFAPLRAQAITKNGGERMTAWCDVAAPWPLTPASADDAAGLALSVAGIHALVRQLEADGVPAERIVLAGFSQVCRNFQRGCVGGRVLKHFSVRDTAFECLDCSKQQSALIWYGSCFLCSHHHRRAPPRPRWPRTPTRVVSAAASTSAAGCRRATSLRPPSLPRKAAVRTRRRRAFGATALTIRLSRSRIRCGGLGAPARCEYCYHHQFTGFAM